MFWQLEMLSLHVENESEWKGLNSMCHILGAWKGFYAEVKGGLQISYSFCSWTFPLVTAIEVRDLALTLQLNTAFYRGLLAVCRGTDLGARLHFPWGPAMTLQGTPSSHLRKHFRKVNSIYQNHNLTLPGNRGLLCFSLVQQASPWVWKVWNHIRKFIVTL